MNVRLITEPSPSADSTDNPLDWLRLVRKHVQSLKYGTVQITVHDSQVTEVVKSEKMRLVRPKASGPPKSQTTGSEPLKHEDN
jgi:hypothetical protein